MKSICELFILLVLQIDNKCYYKKLIILHCILLLNIE